MDENPQLQGEDTETPSTSPVEMITPGDGEAVNPQGAQGQTPEEVYWNSLKGGTQDRIKSILVERDIARAEAEQFKRSAAGQSYQQPYQPQGYGNGGRIPTPEVAAAVSQLHDAGVATNTYVEDKVNEGLSKIVYKMELDNLEKRFSGDDGLPKFDRAEYEDYINRYPQYRSYQPEDVYQKMYSEEIRDWQSQHQSRPSTTKPSPTLRPSKTQVREEPLTREYIERRLQDSDGRQWYEKNLDKINAVISKEYTPEW